VMKKCEKLENRPKLLRKEKIFHMASSFLNIFKGILKKDEDDEVKKVQVKERKKDNGNFIEMLKKMEHAIGGYPRFVVRSKYNYHLHTHTHTHTHTQLQQQQQQQQQQPISPSLNRESIASDQKQDLKLSVKLFWKKYERLNYVLTHMSDGSKSKMMFSSSDRCKFELIRELIRENFGMIYRKMKIKEIDCRLGAIFRSIARTPTFHEETSRFIQSLAGAETVTSTKIGIAISIYRLLITSCKHLGDLGEHMDKIDTEIASFSSPFSLSIAARMLRAHLDATSFFIQTTLNQLVLTMTRLDVKLSHQPLVQRLDTLVSAADWELANVVSRLYCIAKLASDVHCCTASLRSLTGEQWTIRPIHSSSKVCSDMINHVDAYIDLAMANHGRSDKTTSEYDIVRVRAVQKKYMYMNAFYVENEKTIPWLTRQRIEEAEQNRKASLPFQVSKTGNLIMQSISEISQPDTVLTKLCQRYLTTILFRRLLQARKGRLVKRIKRKSSNKKKNLLKNISRMLANMYLLRNHGHFDDGRDRESQSIRPLNMNEAYAMNNLLGGHSGGQQDTVNAFSRDLNMVITSLDRRR